MSKQVEPNHLTLRSGPQDRVSKGGHEQLVCCHPSRRRCAPPQD